MLDPKNDPAKIPFLESQEHLPPYSHENQIPKTALPKAFWIKTILVILYIPAITLFVLSYLRYSKFEHHYQKQAPYLSSFLEIPSPVFESNSIKFETKQFTPDFRDSKYGGDPSPEVDLAWHNLFENNNIRVQREDLNRFGLKSIELADGGFVAQLGVFHELHCLKKVRHWIFKEYYVFPKNYTEEELAEWPAHINHCLDMLRETIMCRGDTSLSTYTWIGEENHRLPTAWDRSPHRCVNWDSLMEWNRERSVEIFANGALIDENGELYP